MEYNTYLYKIILYIDTLNNLQLKILFLVSMNNSFLSVGKPINSIALNF